MSGLENLGLDDALESVPRPILPKATDKLRAVVGLDFHALALNPPGLQVGKQDPDKQTRVGGGFFIGIAQKHRAAADFPRGKLDFRQIAGPFSAARNGQYPSTPWY